MVKIGSKCFIIVLECFYFYILGFSTLEDQIQVSYGMVQFRVTLFGLEASLLVFI